ncbi:MAG TPA: ABC transporter substrate-binding protein [Acidimicrobiia bacterium]
MRRIRWAALVAMAALATSMTTAIASAQGGNEKPQATDIGITEDTIRVAVIADVENPLRPGLFQGSKDGVEGWAKNLNKHGGLANRKVEVDFIDSKLSADDARNAFIKACSEDFAVVGATALFTNNVDDIESCVDKAGAATGLPDIAVVTTEVAQQCSPTTFGINPPTLVCDTQTEHPQTYQANAGRAFYYEKKFGKDIHGIFIFTSDLKSANNANRGSMTQMQTAGIKADDQIDVSALATQSAYTPIIQAMKDDSSNYAQSGSDYNSTVTLRKEAKLQGLTDPKIIWDCTLQCYDRRLVEQGGGDVEGQYVSLLFLPFEEASKNKELKAFVSTVGKDKADGFGAQAWASGVLFQQAVDKIVDKSGVNGITRKALLDELNTGFHKFNANGMIGNVDVSGHKPSACFVLMQVKNGKFVRVTPTKPGTFNCDSRNLKTTKLDLITG